MESAFFIFLKMGRDHILDVNGIDHLLFIIALCATYRISEWKRVAMLVTAFTLGHSLTLAMAALNIITFPPKLIEWLIPITILFTAIYNVFFIESKRGNTKYGLALFFGLIHGMAFSNFFKSMQMSEERGELVKQLFAFNIGVEIGQLLTVGGVLLISYIALNLLKIKQVNWSRGISLIIIIATFYLFYQLT